MARHFITPAALAAVLHTRTAPAIFDLRDTEDAAADPRRIPGAIPVTLAGLEAGIAVSGAVVCTCQRGGKLSQIGAGLLREHGLSARHLFGGHLAWVAGGWPLCGSPPTPARWVMPPDPDWDELAALWVLRRLVDRRARVIAVERDWLARGAEVWSANILPPTASAMAGLAGLDHPIVSRLPGGSDRMVSGRLVRKADPSEAFDLVDDWIAGAEVSA